MRIISGFGIALVAAISAACIAQPTTSTLPTEVKTMTNPPKASRPSAPVVAPVEINGVRYQQDTESSRHGGDQPGGYLVAIDIQTGARLWMLKVYEVEDQRASGVTAGGRYFQSLKVLPDEASLEIINEAGGRYKVDIAKRTAEQIGGPAEKAPAATPPNPKPKP